MKKLIITFIIIIYSVGQVFSHSVQVQYCVSCSGDLRIWLEHWHGSEDPSTTTMTISVTINGNTSTITSSPGGGVMQMTPGSLPGCSTPITYAAGCPAEENTWNDWVYYDFPGLPANVPLSFTIISGNTYFTMDCCEPCMYPLTVDFTINTNISFDDQYICNGDLTMPIIMSNSASWSNSNPSIGLSASGIGSIPSFSPIGPPGTTATIYFTSTCATGSFDYTISPQLSISSLASNYNGNNISCNGYNNGSIDVNINGGSPPYIYNWNNGENSEDLDSLIAGSYSVIITDTNGCSIFDAIVLTEPTSFQTTIAATTDYNGYNISCNGSSDGGIDLSVSGSVSGYTYLWNNSAITEDITSLPMGTYSVDITDINLCATSTEFTLTEPSPLQSLLILSDINGYNVCYQGQDGFIDLTVSGSVPGYYYQWSNGDTTEDMNNLGAGIYSYTATDQNGCLKTDSIEITEPILNIQQTSSNVSCNGGTNGSASVSVSGSTAPFYIFWNNSVNPNLLSAGVYVYQIVDSIGCNYIDSITILEPDSFSVSENITHISCNGYNDGSISLSISGSIPPYIIDWFGAPTVNMIAGTYNYIITDANLCYYSEIALLTEPNPIDVLNQVIDPSCSNTNDGSVSLSISGGTPPYTTDWGSTNANNLGIGTYLFIVTDTNNCIDSNTIAITSESNMIVISSLTEISCEGFCDGAVDLVINGGIPPYTTNWFGINPAFICEGLITYEVTDSVGCLYSESIQINAPDSVIVSIIATGIQLEANANGGTPPYTYQWSDDNGVISSNQIITMINSGNYYCIAIDSNNCQSAAAKYYYTNVDLTNINGTGFNIYPNPSQGLLIIEYTSIQNSDLTVNLINVLGQYVHLDTKKSFTGEYKNQIDLANYAKGVYFINIKLNNQNHYKKLILQ